jgi:hypothetical protein
MSNVRRRKSQVPFFEERIAGGLGVWQSPIGVNGNQPAAIVSVLPLTFPLIMMLVASP